MPGAILSSPVNVGSNSSQTDSASSAPHSFGLKGTHEVPETLDRTPSNSLAVSPSGTIKAELSAATGGATGSVQSEMPFIPGPVFADSTPSASTTFESTGALLASEAIGKKMAGVAAAPNTNLVKPVLRTNRVQDVMTALGVNGVFDNNEEDASVFAEWAHSCDSFLTTHYARRKPEMVNVYASMAKDSELRKEIYALASEEKKQDSHATRYMAVSTKMKKAYSEAVERISAKKIDNGAFEERCYEPDAGCRILGAIRGKPIESVNEKLKAQFSDKYSVKDIVKSFVNLRYSGTLKIFSDGKSVKQYLLQAVKNAPNHQLKLPLGYRNEKRDGKVVCVVARVNTNEEGYALFTDPLTNKELYQVSEGRIAYYKDPTSGETVISGEPGSCLFRVTADATLEPMETIRLTPKTVYSLMDVASDGTLFQTDSLSQLTDCSEFWLYETSKRYSILVTQEKNVTAE
ncbi:hypothetical protein [Glaciimonas sp. GG7]